MEDWVAYLILAVKTLQNDPGRNDWLPEELLTARTEAEIVNVWQNLYPDSAEQMRQALKLINETLISTPLLPVLVPLGSDEIIPVASELSEILQNLGYPSLSTSLEQTPQIGYDVSTIIAFGPLDKEHSEHWLKALLEWNDLYAPKRVIVLVSEGIEIPKIPDSSAFRRLTYERGQMAEELVRLILPNFLEQLLYLKPPSLLTDGTEGEDLIGVDHDALALSRLVCLDSTEDAPLVPLAIAIFGNWGSGKSFFMKQMDRSIGKIAKQRRTKNSDTPGQIQQYVRITFNAWHYVESNLWASLASHIFENLYQPLDRKTDREAMLEERERLLQVLDEKRKETSQTIADIEVAKADREDAEKKYAEALEARNQKQTVYQQIKTGKLIIPAVWKSIPVNDKKNILATLSKVDQALSPNKDDEVDEVDLEVTWEKLKDLKKTTAAIANLASGKGIVMVILGILLYIAFSYLDRWLESPAPIFAALMGVLPLIGSVAEYFKKIKNAQEEFAEAVTAKNKEQLDEVEKELTAAEATLEAQRKKLEVEQDRVKEIEEQIENTYSIKRLVNFLQDKAVGADYTKHLGLLALLRRDFETLEELMKGAEADENAAQMQPATDDDGQESHTHPVKIKRIKRIILFIDDLDRCPPERVVEVLQAIHLLLAFRLFVVVVGVDSRWVTSCLKSHYEKLISSDKIEGVRPDNYLEKIFQFPYWLSPLHTNSTDGYLNELIRSIEPVTSGENKNTEDEPGETPGNSKTSYQPRTQAQIDDVSDEEIIWTEEEVDGLEHISVLAGDTPRSLKRFFNMYRMLRSHPDIWPEFQSWKSDNGNAPWNNYGIPLALCNGRVELAKICWQCVEETADIAEVRSEIQQQYGNSPRIQSLLDNEIEQLFGQSPKKLKRLFEMALKYSFHGHLLYSTERSNGGHSEAQGSQG
ncbi:MAG: P-loop NTPase fold protein [Verrucomicrobiota bacterium]